MLCGCPFQQRFARRAGGKGRLVPSMGHAKMRQAREDGPYSVKVGKLRIWVVSKGFCAANERWSG